MSRIKVSLYRSASEAAVAGGIAGSEVIRPDQAVVVTLASSPQKPRYSKGLKEIQKRNLKFAKLGTRMARAVSGGVEEYLRRAEASALRRKDGVLKDLPKNTARGLRVVLRRSSRLPTDVVRLVPKGRVSRVVWLLAMRRLRRRALNRWST